MRVEVGQKVTSLKVGSVPQFVGEVVSIVENHKNERFVVVVDPAGRSFYRDLHELKPLEAIAA